MDRDGANVRQLTNSGFHTQPRWSPKGDAIVYTQREGVHDLWAIGPGGSNAAPADERSRRQSGRDLGAQTDATSRSSRTARAAGRCT